MSMVALTLEGYLYIRHCADAWWYDQLEAFGKTARCIPRHCVRVKDYFCTEMIRRDQSIRFYTSL
jgi:hypothetical protein